MYVLVDEDYHEVNFGKTVQTLYSLKCYLRYMGYVDLVQMIELLSLQVTKHSIKSYV